MKNAVNVSCARTHPSVSSAPRFDLCRIWSARNDNVNKDWRTYLVGELLVLLFVFAQHLVFDQRFLIQQFYGLTHLDGGVQVLLLLDSFKFVFFASELLIFLAALLKLAKEFCLGAVEDWSWLLLS